MKNSKFTELKNRVTSGDEPGKNRPRLDEQTTPERLRTMIKRCWNTKPEKRPTFAELKKDRVWEKAKKDAISDGSKIYDSILKLFEKDKPVSFKLFLDRFAGYIDEHPKLYFDREEPDSITPEIRLMAFILEIGNITNENVKKENVQRLLIWCSKKMPKKDFLPTLYKLCTEPYFFGKMTQATACDLLEGSKKGKYLLRWSDEDKWVVDFKEKDKVTSSPIKTDAIDQLIKVDLPKKIVELNLNQESYLKKGRPLDLENLKIREEKYYSGQIGYQSMTTVNDPNLQYVDLNRTSSLSHYNFILDDRL